MPVDWVLDYVPGWLGPTAVFVGLLVSSVGLLRQSARRFVSEVRSPGEYLLLASAGGVFFWAVTSLLKVPPFFVRYPTVYVAVFAFAARWIEGAGAVSLYQKAGHVLENASLPGGGVSLRRKALRKLLLLALGIVGSYAAVGAVLFGPVSVPASGVLVVVWTVATFLASLLGLTWKVSRVSDSLPSLLLFGTLLMLAGVEVVNLATVAAEVGVFLAAGAGHLLGYLVTVGLWVTDY